MKKMAEKRAEYQVLKEGMEEVLRIDANKWSYLPSIEDNALVMAGVIDLLAEVPSIGRIIFNQKRNYSYDSEQTAMLVEIAGIYNHLIRDKKIFSLGFNEKAAVLISEKVAALQYLLFNLLRSDPLGTYVEVKRFLREEKINLDKESDNAVIEVRTNYINVLNYILELLKKTRMIRRVVNELEGYVLGDRSLYKNLFRVVITPDFMFTRLMANPPLDGEELDAYSVGENEINIYSVPGDIKYLYHVVPPEFKLTEDKYNLLDLARGVLAEHKPRQEEFLDPGRMRQTFFNIGRDLLQELAQHKDIELNFSEIEELARILVRYTVGFGLIEVLLRDPKIQDVVVNAPIGRTPAFIVHQEYGECVTNIIPAREDGESWASKFRILSGRPLDEANPVLDTELLVPGARARVAIISEPLSPSGLAYSLRRHRDMPWTLPLFIENKMIDSLGAGLLSFLVDGSRSLLIGGTRSSGKSSFLGSLLVEIMRKYRVITLEDSVTGDSEMLIERKGGIEKITIGKLINDLIEKYGCWYNLTENEILGNDEDIKVFSMTRDGKIKLSRVSKFIRHKTTKLIYKIRTRTGREIKVTGDHSLFGLDENANISEVKVSGLKEKDFIAVPRRVTVFKDDVEKINLLDHVSKLKEGFFCGDAVKRFVRRNRGELVAVGKEHNYPYNTIKGWISRGVVPVKIIEDIISLGFNLDFDKDITYKVKSSKNRLPLEIQLDKGLLTLIGIWIADGCYGKQTVLFSVPEPELRKIVYNVARKYGFGVSLHSDKVSLIINSKIFRNLMREVFNLKGDAYTKRIPSWIFNLSDEQIACVLMGIFSGDGSCSEKEIAISLASKGLLNDVQSLLLRLGVSFRIWSERKDKCYSASICNLKSFLLFKEKIDFLQKYKCEKLNLLCNKISTHDSSDVIPLSLVTKRKVKEIYSDFNTQDYISRNNNVGRERLGSILKQISSENILIKNLNILAKSDILWDQIKSIELVNDHEGYVYDISVPECESFVCNNIIAHNTKELPTDALRELGYNIQSMKVRSALMTGGAEMGADEGIRTSLRMGDSSLIVGEIRSLEAKALWEAMRIGALANVVAGTIHGADPYSIFDRVVNDLGVPRTSFKATDIIVVANPIKSPDGLHSWKRILQIAEVRKHWEEDPLRERGFVDLMKYNPETDKLEPSDDLINGDSEVLKSVASNIKEWAGDWDAVWENILLRAKIKQALVDYSKKLDDKSLLEADFVVNSNDAFHKIGDSVREEVGGADNKRIYFEWEDWLKRKIREREL